MKRIRLLTSCFLLPTLVGSIYSISSCANNNKNVLIQTNFSSNEATLNNDICFLRKDYDTTISVKNGLQIAKIDIVIDNLHLVEKTDFFYEINNKNVISLHIKGSVINYDALKINLFFSSFNATFHSNDTTATIDTTLIKYNVAFEAKITIKKYTSLSYLEVSSSASILIDKQDYSYEVEDNVITLSIPFSSIKYSNLFISVVTAPKRFDANIIYENYKSFHTSSLTATVNEDYDINFVWWEDNIVFKSIVISNSTRVLNEGDDYTCELLYNVLKIHIYKQAITVDDLTISINAAKEDIKSIPISVFSISYKQDLRDKRIIPYIKGADIPFDLKDWDTLKIPNFIIEIDNSCFSLQFTKEIHKEIQTLLFPIDTQIEKINDNAFEGCTSFIGDLNFPKSLLSIGKSAFSGCNGFTSLVFPENSRVTSLGDNCFSDCTGLKGELTIPNSIANLGSNVFSNCTNLTSINFSNFTKYDTLSDGCFSGCTSLTGEINIPSSIKKLGQKVFNDCANLTSINFLDSSKISSIGDGCFSNCEKISGNFTIPQSITVLNKQTFKGCKNLSVIKFDDKANISKIDDECFSGCEKINGENNLLSIPNTITELGKEAFKGCKTFERFNIPDKITNIGEGCFENCENFTGDTYFNFLLPVTLTHIGKGAFKNCKNLKQVQFPSDPSGTPPPLEIEDEAFAGCSNVNFLNFFRFTSIPSFLKPKSGKNNIFTGLPDTGRVRIREDQDAEAWQVALENCGLPKTWNIEKR